MTLRNMMHGDNILAQMIADERAFFTNVRRTWDDLHETVRGYREEIGSLIDQAQSFDLSARAYLGNEHPDAVRPTA